jgi:uncharacterized integral membrane protein
VRLGRKLGSDELHETWQPRLWAVIGGIAVLFVYLVLLIVKNNRQVEVHFVLWSTTVSLVWVIVLSLGIGLLAGLLLSQLYRRRTRRSTLQGEQRPQRPPQA